MASTREVLQAFTDFLNRHINGCFTGKVISVDFDNCLCEVEYNDLTFECMLKASIDGQQNAFVIYPVVGSFVFCVNENNSKNRYAVLMVNEIDKIVINGGENGGLAIVPKLIDHLNNIETAFNNLLNEYKTHVHTSAAPGSLTTPMTPVSLIADINDDFSDIENIKIKH